jgi:hypothetical protein
MLQTATQKVVEKVVNNYVCEFCDYNSKNLTNYKKHLMTEKHRKQQVRQDATQKVVEKVVNNYVCEICHYNSKNLTNYKKHLMTEKHRKQQSCQKLLKKSESEYKCCCGNIYKHRTSYYRHINKCKCDNIILHNNTPHEEQKISVDIVLKILEENKSLQDLLIKQQEEFMKQQEEHNKKYEN